MDDMIGADLENIINSVRFGIVELNKDLTINFCNKSWLEITGYAEKECLNSSFNDFLASGSVSIFKNALDLNRQDNTCETLWIKDSKGEILSFQFVINRGGDDSWILELNHSGKAVGTDSSKITDLYYEADEKGVIKNISSDIAQTLYYTPEECLNKHSSFLYEHPDKRRELSGRLLSKGEIHHHHDSIVNKKGQKINVVENLEKIYHVDGSYMGFSCIIKYDAVSGASRNQGDDCYLKFWDITNEGLLLHKRGLILDANPIVEKILGYTRDELVGDYVINLAVKTEWKETVLNKMVLQDSDPYEIEGLRKNGEVFPAEIESRNLLYDGEEVRITAIRDLSGNRNAGKLVDKDKILEILEQSADRKTGYKYFESVILNISKLLRADMVFLGRFTDAKSHVETLATCAAGVMTENIRYSVEDTPCEGVVREHLCSFTDDVYKRFPKDPYLQEEKFKGYIGVELKNSKGKPIGILVSLFKKKILNVSFAETVAKVFSQRLESELERTLIEDELKSSTNMLKLILNNIPVNVYWKDKQLKYLGGNQSFVKDAGFESEEALKGKTDYDTPWKEEADLYAVSDRSVLKSGLPQLDEEGPQTLSNGKVRWIKISKVPMKDEKNNTIGLLGINEDVTEKKLIESSVRESENRFRNLAENIPGVIYVCQFDSSHTFIYLNENIKDLTGYSKSRFMEEHISLKDIIHPEDFPFVFDQKKMAVNNHTAYQIQFRIKHRDGSWRWVEESGAGSFSGDELLHLEGVMMDVTSRVDAENLIKESEVKFRSLIENLSGVFWIGDLKTSGLDYISPQYETIWERPLSEIYEDPGGFIKSIHPKDKYRVIKKFRKMKLGEPMEDVYRILCGNGKEKTIWVSSSSYADGDNGVSKIVGYAEDITDKANIEKTLKESEIKFKTLIENLDGMTYIFDLENKKVEYVSPQYEKIWGRKREDFLKEPFDLMNVVHPDDLGVVRENMKKIIRGKNIRQKFRIMVDNQIKVISGTINYLKDKQGSSSKILGYSEDITSSEKTKEEIEKLALVSEKTNNAIIITDQNCKIEWINNAFSRFSGYALEDIKNQYIQFYLYGPGTTEENITRIKVAIENRMKTKVETVINSVTGQNRWVEININPVFDQNGNFEKLFAVLIDITNRKVNEEAIRKQNQELLKTNQELDNFVYRVSHDLKAPISSVKGLINIIKLERSRTNLEACVDRIEESMDKLDSFILDILDYSRNSRFEIESSKIDLEKEVEDIFHELKYLDQSESIQKVITAHGETYFYSDKRRIKFILNNLISNAIRFSNPLQQHQKIEIDIKVNKKEAVIRCSDNGIGIEKEYVDKIFGMFFRATEVKAGSGLGLYIVKEAVDKLQGRVKVESQVNEGSTFIVYLPNRSNTAPIE